jgi:hypothetical protein
MVNEPVYKGVDPKRSYLNNSKTASVNFLLKPSKTIDLRGMVYFVWDKTKQEQSGETRYLTTNPAITLQEKNALQKKISYSSYLLEGSWRLTEKKLLKYTGRYEKNQIRNFSDLIFLTQPIQPTLNNHTRNIEQRLHYTQRVTKKMAIDAEWLYSRTALPQELNIQPGQYAQFLGLGNDPLRELRQKSVHITRQVAGIFRLLGQHKTNNYALSTGYTSVIRNYDVHSEGIKPGNEVVATSALFNADYAIKNPKIYIDAAYTTHLFGAELNLNTTFNHEELNIHDTKDHSPVLDVTYNYFQHRAGLSYKTKKWGKFSLQYVYKNRLPLITDLLPVYRLNTYRSFENGNAVFLRSDENNIGFTYSLADFYKKQILIYGGIVYNTNPSNFISNQQPKIIYDVNSRLPLINYNNSWLYFGRLEKYTAMLHGNLVLDVNSYRSNYRNQTNGVENNTFFTVTTSKIGFRSVWKDWFNLNISSTLKINRQKTLINTNTTQNITRFYENRLNLFFTPKGERLTIELAGEHYIIPRRNKNYALLFADVNVQYIVIKEKLILNLVGVNLLNNKTLSFDNITPLLATTDSYSIMPGYIMAKIFYKF